MRILILGGGMAGVACAQTLGDHHVAVTLVDRNGYLQFKPLLYQVATSQLPAEDIARPHRTIFADNQPPYPHPPVSHEPKDPAAVRRDGEVGLHPFHAPCGIMLDEAEHGPRVQR